MTIRIPAISVALMLAWLAASGPVLAQSPAPTAKLFAPGADIPKLIERARRERKPDQANFVQPIVQLPPYNVNLEFRVAGQNATASVHESDAELFLVIEGRGTVVTGGKLKDERRTNPQNLQGSAIEGGSSRALVKGDWVLVPEKTPHWFTQIDGELVLMSVHLPHQP
jgi:mannose-6-phosphate isomerase-like protein (cupin superfamily)